MNVAGQVLDFYDDENCELMSKIAMPAEVKHVQCAILDSDQRDRLPNTDFGLVVLTKHAHTLRKFPVNDPGNAWLSARYFEKNHEKLAFPARFKAATFIKRACDAYQVPSGAMIDAYAMRADPFDVESNFFTEGSEQGWMLRKLAQSELLTKQASASEIDALVAMPDGQFALVYDAGDGQITRKYAMPDAEHVKKAADYFDKYAMQLEPAHRHMFATAVKRRAGELEVEIASKTLQKWASEEWNDKVDWHLEARKQLLAHDHQQGARKILDKLAASLGETTPVDMAKALEKFDQGTGLDRYYGKGLADPYASTMGKVASAWSEDSEDGQTITEADLRKIPATKIAGYLGQSFAGQFQKNPVEIYESLPDPDKVLIRQLVSGEA